MRYTCRGSCSSYFSGLLRPAFFSCWKWMKIVGPFHFHLSSGKRNYGKSPFFMGKSTISMVMFNSYVTNYQRVSSSKNGNGKCPVYPDLKPPFEFGNFQSHRLSEANFHCSKRIAGTPWYINIDPGSCWGWKIHFHQKIVMFRVYVSLPGGNMFSTLYDVAWSCNVLASSARLTRHKTITRL